MKIPSDILRVYKTLHTWTGIVSGLVLFIGFFAGALTMFKQPLDLWAAASSRSPLVAYQAGEQDDRLIQALLREQPASRHGFSLHLKRDHDSFVAPVSWSGTATREIDLSGRRWLAHLGPEGKVQVTEASASSLGALVDLLHRTAGIPGVIGDEYVGIYIMGVAAVLYFLALASGVVLALPTLVRDFLLLRDGHNRKRFWLDAHSVLGLVSLPFHVVICLTVIVFAFHDQIYGALSRVVYGDHKMFAPPPAAAQPYAPNTMLPVARLVERIRAEAPGFEVTELEFIAPTSRRPLVRVALESPAAVVRGPQSAYLLLHPYTGQVLDHSMLPGRQSVWSAPVNTFFALHFGSFGGIATRWLYFALGLMGAGLFYTGNLLWLQSRLKRQKSGLERPVAQKRSVRLMAAATVGVCLGSIAGVCAALVAGKLLMLSGWSMSAVYLSSYYALFVGALVCAFWCGAARASVQLLRLCSTLAAAIPLTSLAACLPASLLPLAPAWRHGSMSAIAVDAVAAAAAFGFAWAAGKVRVKMLNASQDTIWSV